MPAANASTGIPVEPAAEPGGPIVLLHGIGLGLVPYLGLLHRLITAHGAACPILLPEFPHISQKIGGPPPPAPETCRAIRAMLCRHCPASRPDASGDGSAFARPRTTHATRGLQYISLQKIGVP